MSGSMILLQLESLLMSVAQVTTKGQADVCGLGYHQRPRGYLRTVLPPEAMGISRPRLLLGAMSGLWSYGRQDLY